MSHGIILPIDRILSTKGTEWHQLAIPCESIGEKEAAQFFAVIREGKISIDCDGVSVPMGNHKALVADYRAARPDLVGTEHEFSPLHIPKNSYRAISNGEVWGAMRDALQGVDCEVSSIGTLEAGKKFFVSVGLTEDSQVKICGEKWLANVNFITSHDGTLAFRAYDSLTRIVCMNTLRASLQTAGEIGFSIYHSQGADLKIGKMSELLNALLTGRKAFALEMEKAANETISEKSVERFTAGFFALKTGTDELSTRAQNQTAEIVRLFKSGIGNKGQSVYDAVNGATEYWSSGEGTGKNSGKSERAYKANFGGAADSKTEYVSLLLGNKRDAVIDKGEKVLANN